MSGRETGPRVSFSLRSVSLNLLIFVLVGVHLVQIIQLHIEEAEKDEYLHKSDFEWRPIFSSNEYSIANFRS